MPFNIIFVQTRPFLRNFQN